MNHNAPKVETLYFCPDTGERVESRVACRMAGHGHDARAEEYVPRAQARRVVVTFPDGEVPPALARALAAIESAVGPLAPVEQTKKPSHICLDCGAVGHAGGYHDHGNGNAGDTAAISEVLRLLREAGAVEDERDSLAEQLARAAEQTRDLIVERLREEPAVLAIDAAERLASLPPEELTP